MGIRAVKMAGVNFLAIQPLRQTLEEISQERKYTMAQVAINWVRGHGAVFLVGCRTVKQVEAEGKSAEWDLSPDEISSLDGLSLDLSLSERPLYRRSLFVVFISLLQLSYYTEQGYRRLKRVWFPTKKAAAHVE